MSATGGVSTVLGYIQRGWSPVPIPDREKSPNRKGWLDLRITAADAPRHWNGEPKNIGVILGSPSGNLVDADLDCPEAVAMAGAFLPPTESVFGREGKRRSHQLYTAVVPKRIEFADPDDGECLLELRSNGGQTVFPGSVHVSGELVEWDEDGDPAQVDASALAAAAGRLAGACLLVRAAPSENRHAYLVTIAGALVRGLGANAAAHVLGPVARHILGGLYSREAGDRLISDTKRKVEAGKPATGWPSLVAALGEKRAKKVAEWLGVIQSGTQSKPVSGDQWNDDLHRNDRGDARDIIHNVVLILRADKRFAGRLRWNQLLEASEARDVPWRAGGWAPWEDADDLHLANWAQQRHVYVKPSTCAAAVQLVARDVLHHPVRERLSALVWDGTPRLAGWLQTYLGATVPEDCEKPAAKLRYLARVGPAWMISAVARIFDPGCKADHVLILEGTQNIGKSTAAATLAIEPSWFADEIADLGTKDSAQDLRGKWIIELGELSAMNRSAVERVKAFVSRQVDHYRQSYGRRSQDFPRQCVFIGSTNADAYLGDETGGRRFWPVRAGQIDVPALLRDRDQLWAEAVMRYRAGETWWLDKETEAAAQREQDDRRTIDPWEERVMKWALRQIQPVTVSDALYDLGVQLDKRDQAAENRVARILRANRWTRRQRRVAGVRIWEYVKPATDPDDAGPGPVSPVPPPVSPVPPPPTGDGKPSKSAPVTSVTGVTSMSPARMGAHTHARTHAAGFKPLLVTGDTGDTDHGDRLIAAARRVVENPEAWADPAEIMLHGGPLP